MSRRAQIVVEYLRVSAGYTLALEDVRDQLKQWTPDPSYVRDLFRLRIKPRLAHPNSYFAKEVRRIWGDVVTEALASNEAARDKDLRSGKPLTYRNSAIRPLCDKHARNASALFAQWMETELNFARSLDDLKYASALSAAKQDEEFVRTSPLIQAFLRTLAMANAWFFLNADAAKYYASKPSTDGFERQISILARKIRRSQKVASCNEAASYGNGAG